jgi:hypothetical protein
VQVTGTTLVWSELDEDPFEGARSGDPLGLRVLVRHLGGRISPGLTRRSMQVWGFGLLVLGVRLAGHGPGAERRFLRWQRLLALAAAHEEFHSGDESAWTTGGIELARRLVSESAQVPLGRPLLTHERSAGIWGGYARPARMYGLLWPGRLGDKLWLTERGDELATATQTALGIASVNRHAATVDDRDDVRADLDAFPLSFGDPSQRMITVLSRAVRTIDKQQSGGRLAALWPHLADLDEPDPRQLALTRLDHAEQRLLIADASSVAELVEQVETAFRAKDPAGFSLDLAEHPAFDLARTYGYADEFEAVRAALVAGDGGVLERLWKVHTERHARAGRWREDEEVEPWSKAVPDFGLDAVTSLHQQGVRLGR